MDDDDDDAHEPRRRISLEGSNHLQDLWGKDRPWAIEKSSSDTFSPLRLCLLIWLAEARGKPCPVPGLHPSRC